MSYSDFDAPAQPKGKPEVEVVQVTTMPRNAVFGETEMGRIALGLNSFIQEVLPRLSEEQLHRLVSALPAGVLEHSAQDYGADFSLAAEIGLQIVAVQNLRQHVFPNGHLREGCNIREAKEVLTTCNVMIKTLMDNHDRVMNMERMRAVEAATVDVLIDLDPTLKEAFLERMQSRLEALA